MQAVILAAGMGKRLGKLTENNTKCMIEVNGITLIDRMLNQLEQLQLSRIILVIGYKGENLQKYISRKYPTLNIEYIENSIFDKTNNIYSLFLAKEYLLEDDTILLESDLIFDFQALELLVNNPYPNLALVAKYETWMDGTMVRLDEDNNIVNFISKKAFRYNDIDLYYKTVNIYKFSKKFSTSYYVPFLEAYSKALGNNEYYEQVLRVITLLENCDLKALPLEGEKWYEIDDIQDLDIAETLFAKDREQKLNLYQKRYGGYWRFDSLLDFCYLVNPYFPPKKLKDELKSNFDRLLSEYPSGMFVNSLLISKYFGLKQDFVCVGNGAAELIKSLLKFLVGNIGIIYPTFEEYPNRLEKECVIPFIPQNKDFSYCVDDLIEFYNNKDISFLLLINPDNPSGNFIHKKEVLRILQWAKTRNITLILDESFVDFTDESVKNTLLVNQILSSNSNLIVIKSISKSYGVPGLRLGIIASSNMELIRKIKTDVAIWNINSFAEFYMQIFNKYESDYIKGCEKIIQERKRFFIELSKIDYLRIIPSQSNYFLCQLTNGFSSKELATTLLCDYNIFIKDCSGKSIFKNLNYVRIAIRDKKDNQQLIEALKYIKHENN